jgi:7-cyano-7-deazaguanine reductase
LALLSLPAALPISTNRVLDDLVAACAPRRMRVVGAFTARGGISTNVVCDYTKPGA